MNFYAACDRAIQTMNREILKDFGRLKLADWDEIHVIRTVKTVYRKSVKKAKQQYYEEAFEAYLLALALLDYDRKRAYPMAEKAINDDWIEKMLNEVDPVTGYRFESEAERKAERLAEELEVSNQPNQAIDKAVRYWSKQCGQFAINFTDWAMLKGYKDAGVKKVMWVTQRDERVCEECSALNGLVFDIDDAPAKPHLGCRCRLVPVKE